MRIDREGLWAALVGHQRARGRHKVMFGRNWPMIPPARALEALAELRLDAEVAECFLGANARRVFRLERVRLLELAADLAGAVVTRA